MDAAKPLPRLWLLSDARNDAAIEAALARLPRGSALVVRHYHLDLARRRERFRQLAMMARRRGIAVVLAGTPERARRWGADGVYASAALLARRRRGRGTLHAIATAHDGRELALAARAGAAAAMLSPVFATRSHPGAAGLGPVRFRLLAARAGLPVIALGGMDRRKAARLGWPRWAAIDGLAGAAALRGVA